MEVELCDDLLQEIFSLLPPSSTLSLSLVSRRFLRLSRSSVSHLSLLLLPPTHLSLSHFLSTFPHLNSISLSPSLLLSATSTCPHLRVLRVLSGTVSGFLLVIVSFYCPKLVSLSVSVGRGFDFEVFGMFGELKEVSINFTNKSSLEVRNYPDLGYTQFNSSREYDSLNSTHLNSSLHEPNLNYTQFNSSYISPNLSLTRFNLSLHEPNLRLTQLNSSRENCNLNFTQLNSSREILSLSSTHFNSTRGDPNLNSTQFNSTRENSNLSSSQLNSSRENANLNSIQFNPTREDPNLNYFQFNSGVGNPSFIFPELNSNIKNPNMNSSLRNPCSSSTQFNSRLKGPNFDGELQLESLTLSCIRNDDYALSWLYKSCRKLKKLQFRACECIGVDPSSNSFISCIKNIQEVELRTCRMIINVVLLKLAENSKYLKSLLVYDGGCREGLLRFIEQSNCDLQNLDFRLPLDLDNRHLIAVAEKFRGLKSLKLQSCVLVTGEGLKAICSSIRDGLEELALINCDVAEKEPGLLTTLGQNLKGLRKLDLSYNEALVDKEFVSMIVSCGNLEELKLRGCRGLSNLALVSISKCCKNLEFVDMMHCCGIKAEDVELFVRNLPRLRELSVEDNKVSDRVKSWRLKLSH